MRSDLALICLYLFFIGYSVGPNTSLSLERISSFVLFLDQLDFKTQESEK